MLHTGHLYAESMILSQISQRVTIGGSSFLGKTRVATESFGEPIAGADDGARIEQEALGNIKVRSA